MVEARRRYLKNQCVKSPKTDAIEFVAGKVERDFKTVQAGIRKHTELANSLLDSLESKMTPQVFADLLGYLEGNM